MCLEPDKSFWINLFVWVCFLAHENHQVQVQIDNEEVISFFQTQIYLFCIWFIFLFGSY